jgi:glycosyltransferase involved in cell wall biosynthesis
VLAERCDDVAAFEKKNMKADSLRVCLMAPVPPPYGGIGKWTILVRCFSQARSDVKIDIVDTAPRWRAIDDMAVWKRALGGGIQLLRDYSYFLRMLLARPDVLHLTTSGQLAIIRDIVVLITARVFKVPAIYHIHFGRVAQIASKNTHEWRLLALAIRLAHVVIAIDPATATVIKQHLPQVQTLRIPNGIDLNGLPELLPSSGISVAMRTVLFLGWVIPSKGIAELVQAWSITKVDGWHCVIAGPGAEKYREELREQLHPENLEFLPEQAHDAAMKLMASADVFVLPSYSEGFPNVIIEAMAMGKPVIATSVGAIPEMLSDGCGVLIPPRDVKSLTEALVRVLADVDLRIAMGVRAQKKARSEYAMDKVFEQLVSAWMTSVG